MKMIRKDIVGEKFGKLTVQDDYIKIPNGTKWKCLCDCGNEIYVYRGKLTTGHTRSCGCITQSLKGLSKHKLYKVWWGIKERCYSKNHASYKNYGAKGIILCDEWLKNYKAFYDWSMANGWEEHLSIDRIDSNKHYEPSNCQWIPLEENIAKSNASKPHRKTKFLYYGISPDGKRYEFGNANQFAKEHSLTAGSIRQVARGERPRHKEWIFGFTNIPNT